MNEVRHILDAFVLIVNPERQHAHVHGDINHS